MRLHRFPGVNSGVLPDAAIWPGAARLCGPCPHAVQQQSNLILFNYKSGLSGHCIGLTTIMCLEDAAQSRAF